MGQLDGKVAVVTGGSEGIGAAAARRFTAEDATVYVTGRRQTELNTTVKEINSRHNGGKAIAVRSDVSVPEDLDRLYARVREDSDRIDVLFANAGVVESARLGDITAEQFDRVFGINVRGLVFTVQKALPLLSHGASVILPSSVAASKGIAATSIYNATKAAVRSFARTWAAELADREIRVNAVSPGPIETPGFADFSGAGADPVKAVRARQDFLATVPMGRMGDPDEVAAAVLFLATDASKFSTGAEVSIDGGQAQV